MCLILVIQQVGVKNDNSLQKTLKHYLQRATWMVWFVRVTRSPSYFVDFDVQTDCSPGAAKAGFSKEYILLYANSTCVDLISLSMINNNVAYYFCYNFIIDV